MRYRELVQFDPIESVIQLRTADEKSRAQHLVRTYVVSNRMADQMVNTVIPQLQFHSPQDNKGVLIVGNYGTGKSHLMAFLSAVAEFADLKQDIDNARVRDAADAIAGRFKVTRLEIGSVTRSLRDIVLDGLSDSLQAWGIAFTFPPADQVSNNKDMIIEAVAAFQERYPTQGILLVVDELLDYLRGREERQLILDLGFLRELGEVTAVTPFRFMGGLQETLFDNPRFSFVAQQLRRVRDRFEQVRIVREDIAYVVSHRLLVKTDAQRARIEEHLRRFTPLYHEMAERINEYAELFPVHPAYIETFQRVYIAEKREVLRTLSQAIRGILDSEVPDDAPGLISYDHYWNILRENASIRSVPEVATVIDKSNILEGRVRHAYTRPHLLATATRIIHALSVQRLTTDDIYVPVGVTPEELRDGLCLYMSMPEENAEFLLNQVQVALREIMRTVSGQYISFNEANNQYYLDVKKDIDFDAKIAERGDLMGDDELNRFFFAALGQTFSLSDSTYVTGYRIWFYELPWTEHKVMRPGYLFFGAPDDRSTAQPPRDFYVYILPPFLHREWHDGELADEVIFQIGGLDDTFTKLLRAYAGARVMSTEAASHQTTYAEKADAHLRALTRWLRDHLPSHLMVRYQGVEQPVRTVLAQVRSTSSPNIEELVRLVASHLLAGLFTERYPAYPHFSRLREPVGSESRAPSAEDAVRALAGRARTSLATAVLAGLELLDEEDNVRPYNSRYARHFLEQLQDKPENQFLNRGELIEQVAAGIVPIEKDIAFHLEPEWVVVVLLSLVFNGDMELTLQNGTKLDASNISQAANTPMPELVQFRYCARPRDLPVNIWVRVFEGLGLSPGLVRDPNARNDGVRDLQRFVGGALESTVLLENRLGDGVHLWNESLFTETVITVQDSFVVDARRPDVTLTQTDVLPPIRQYKRFLEHLKTVTTAGRMRNFRLSLQEVEGALEAHGVVRRVKRLLDLVSDIQPLTTYLAEARANQPDAHPWSQRADVAKQEMLSAVRSLGRGEELRSPADIRRDLEGLKNEYTGAYAELHRSLVLGPQPDDRRRRIYRDPRLMALGTLSAVDLMNTQELEAWKDAIGGLKTCRNFYEGLLANTPTCPYCFLRPIQYTANANAEATLDHLDRRLDEMLTRWRRALRDNLNSERSKQSLQAMSPDERRAIQAFLEQDEDSTDVPAGFVESANQALRGIEAVTLSVENLLEHLRAGGLPCSDEDLQHRFAAFLREAMRGHDAESTRLTLDK